MTVLAIRAFGLAGAWRGRDSVEPRLGSQRVWEGPGDVHAGNGLLYRQFGIAQAHVRDTIVPQSPVVGSLP